MPLPKSRAMVGEAAAAWPTRAAQDVPATSRVNHRGARLVASSTFSKAPKARFSILRPFDLSAVDQVSERVRLGAESAPLWDEPR
jgi:hypothetical protein